MKVFVMSVGKKKNTLSKKICNWMLVILYLICIFAFSQQTGTRSNQLSTYISDTLREHTQITQQIQQKIMPNRIDYNFMFRKFAHFMEYLLLVMLLVRALRVCNIRGPSSLLFAFFICSIYASFDEWHQGFVVGRSSRWADIMIDNAGALFGIILVNLRDRWKKKTKRQSRTF